MFNIGPLELMVILIIALLIVGPKRLPEVGRSIGRGLREFRKAQEEVRETLRVTLEEEPGPPAPSPKTRTGPPPPEPAPDATPTPEARRSEPTSPASPSEAG